MSRKAVVFGVTLAAPMAAATGAEAYVPDDTGAPEPTKQIGSADALERQAAPEPAPPSAPEPAPDPKPAEHQALKDVAPAPEPAPAPAPAPAPVDPKPAEHQTLRDVEPAPAPEPSPAPEGVKPNEHQALRDLEAAPTPAPEDVKPNEHQALRDLDPQPADDPADDEPRGDGDGPLPPHGGIDPQLWAHLPPEDQAAIREEQQREEDELQLREWEQNPPDYVALGDSYSAGTGTIPDGEDPAGQRTDDAYGPEIAEARNYDIEHVAYGGATTENVLEGQGDEPPQVDAVDASTDVVTISIGGNDVGFSDVAGECGNPINSDDDCLERVDEAQAYIEDELPARLDEVYSEIDTRAPEAEVVVVGYPRLWDQEAEDDGNGVTDFSADEIEQLNATGDLLDVTIGEQAREYGFEYVDPRMTFEGHGVGSDDEYLNGLSADWGRLLDGDPPVDDDSFHPNEAGYDALGELVTQELED